MARATTLTAVALSLVLAVAVAPGDVAAQAPAGGLASLAPRPELRLDVIAARSTALHAGGGVSAALGTYARLDLVAAAGPYVDGSRSADRLGASARVDAIVRFVFDPYLQFRRGVYAGAGLSGRFESGDRGRALLVAVVGVEGARRGSVFPAAEVGIGGGIRAGVVLRWARPDRR